ncbi:hypothetical protein ABF179_002147 [Flavobacterium psychrophilum]
MISCTLNQYKESFKTNLLAFLNEYEDNTKTFFLQNEKTKYQEYQKALTKIADQMKFFTREELNQNLVHRSIASDLKSIDQNIYNSIITELNPLQDETILSLSAAKKDRIKINELELENHIKSSIVILKFISVESEEALNTKSTDLDDFTVDNELEQIITDLWNWHKDYEAKHKYISISGIFEEKADYVTDTYKNYEERYLKYQLENCNIFLEEVPNDEVLIDCKKKLENKLIELRQQIPLPAKNIDVLINEMNNAFYRLEQFMKGKILDYKSFLFNDAFTLLLNELNKLENVNIKYDSIGNTYWYLMNQLDYAYDKSEFENQDAYKNEAFNRDSNEISYIQWHRMEELNGKSDLEDYQFELPSIIDIFNNTEVDNKNVQDDNKINNPETTDNSNPYPRIFTSHKAFDKFKKLREEFGNTQQNLSNYSFIYHRMVKDKFIYEDYKQTEFVFFLLDFDINISRIKPKTQLGNNDLRESIYNNLK